LITTARSGGRYGSDKEPAKNKEQSLDKQDKTPAEKFLERIRGAQSTSLSYRTIKVSLPKAPWEEDTKQEGKDDGIQE
jgi:hypothetical protein